MPAFFVERFGAVWMKYAMQELDSYFLVAVASSLCLSGSELPVVYLRVTYTFGCQNWYLRIRE